MMSWAALCFDRTSWKQNVHRTPSRLTVSLPFLKQTEERLKQGDWEKGEGGIRACGAKRRGTRAIHARWHRFDRHRLNSVYMYVVHMYEFSLAKAQASDVALTKAWSKYVRISCPSRRSTFRCRDGLKQTIMHTHRPVPRAPPTNATTSRWVSHSAFQLHITASRLSGVLATFSLMKSWETWAHPS